MQFEKQGSEIAVSIATGCGVADQLRSTDYKKAEPRSIWNSANKHEAVKALITEISLVKFSIITIKLNFIILPNCVVHEMSLLKILCLLISSLQLSISTEPT
jgi:hypothetical protein